MKPVLNSKLSLVLTFRIFQLIVFNPLNAKLNPIRHLLALVGAHHTVHVSRVRVKKTAFTNKVSPQLETGLV